MTIQSEITKLETNLAAAYTAASGKGATLPASENFDNLATCIASIPSGGSTGKYALLDRVTDDSNNEIGTISGFFTDANDVEYAVVCLDAQYRLASGQWCSNMSSAVTNMPKYQELDVWSAKESATTNTQNILNFCTSNTATSSACTHCRSKNFTINSIVYYGQLPNLLELVDILKYRDNINSSDTSTDRSLIISSWKYAIWTSNQCGNGTAWYFHQGGNAAYIDKNQNRFIIPVLEIPNAV